MEPVRRACIQVEKLASSARQKVNLAAKQGDSSARQLMSDLAQLRREREQPPPDDDMLAAALVEWVQRNQAQTLR